MEGFLGLLKSKRVDVASLVGGEFSLDDAPKAYTFLEKQPRVALILSDPNKTGATAATTVTFTATQAKKVTGKINIALVGPGSFAKELLPATLRRNANFNLRWVVSSNPLLTRQMFARKYHFQKNTCDYKDVLNDPETNLVIISAPNNLHYQMVLDAIKAGKPAFVEKPLCLTRGSSGHRKGAG